MTNMLENIFWCVMYLLGTIMLFCTAFMLTESVIVLLAIGTIGMISGMFGVFYFLTNCDIDEEEEA